MKRQPQQENRSDMKIELGDLAKDVVTGFEGVVIGITEWLHGCTTVTVRPTELHDGKQIDSASFDEPQLEIVKKSVVPSKVTIEPVKARRTGGPHDEPRRAGR